MYNKIHNKYSRTSAVRPLAIIYAGQSSEGHSKDFINSGTLVKCETGSGCKLVSSCDLTAIHDGAHIDVQTSLLAEAVGEPLGRADSGPSVLGIVFNTAGE